MQFTELSGGSIGAWPPEIGARPDRGTFEGLVPQGGRGTAEADPTTVAQRVVAPSPADSPPSARERPAPEVAANRPPERTVGDAVLKGLRSVQASEAAVRRMGSGPPAMPDGPTLKVAARLPGPAGRQPAQAGQAGEPEIAGAALPAGDGGRNPQFDAILDQLRQVSGYTVQVAVLSKAVGSLTGSVNKLIASG